MNRFIENQNDLLFFTDLHLCCDLVNKWIKQKPDNKELIAMSKALVGITFYTNKLHLDRYSYDQLISMYRQDKCRAIERARSSEQKVEQLEQKIKLSKYEL